MSFTVKIRQWNEPIQVESGATILEAATDAGVPYPYGCQSGNCVACKSHLISGEVEMSPYSDFALTDEACLIASPLQSFASILRGAVINPWLGKDDKAVVQVRLTDDRLLEAVCDQPNPEEYDFPGGSFGFSLDLGDATVSQIEAIWLRHPAAGLNIDTTKLLPSETSRSESTDGGAENPIFADFENAARVDI